VAAGTALRAVLSGALEKAKKLTTTLYCYQSHFAFSIVYELDIILNPLIAAQSKHLFRRVNNIPHSRRKEFRAGTI
jgi:hypothetical protein